ncbi:hypothetical protein BR93DRAFT_730456 [Coniochaeta sp. PMI_546]|nr:hypothetical protein BR93DRAFT_730456 [Coniochaeta sp. PMI_546]
MGILGGAELSGPNRRPGWLPPDSPTRTTTTESLSSSFRPTAQSFPPSHSPPNFTNLASPSRPQIVTALSPCQVQGTAALPGSPTLTIRVREGERQSPVRGQPNSPILMQSPFDR